MQISGFLIVREDGAVICGFFGDWWSGGDGGGGKGGGGMRSGNPGESPLRGIGG